jgi:hypothetical protein
MCLLCVFALVSKYLSFISLSSHTAWLTASRAARVPVWEDDPAKAALKLRGNKPVCKAGSVCFGVLVCVARSPVFLSSSRSGFAANQPAEEGLVIVLVVLDNRDRISMAIAALRKSRDNIARSKKFSKLEKCFGQLPLCLLFTHTRSWGPAAAATTVPVNQCNSSRLPTPRCRRRLSPRRRLVRPLCMLVCEDEWTESSIGRLTRCNALFCIVWNRALFFASASLSLHHWAVSLVLYMLASVRLIGPLVTDEHRVEIDPSQIHGL